MYFGFTETSSSNQVCKVARPCTKEELQRSGSGFWKPKEDTVKKFYVFLNITLAHLFQAGLQLDVMSLKVPIEGKSWELKLKIIREIH